jgi:hypothetical protein
MNRVTSRAPRPTYFLPAVAAAIASGVLLAACGGGGGGDSGTPSGTPSAPTPAPPASSPTPSPPASAISRADATADAGNGLVAGAASARMVDDVYDATLKLAGSISGATPGAAPVRAQAQGNVHPQVISTTDVNLTCVGGGTATITITGGTDASEHNSTFDAGEVYDVTFTSCVGLTGLDALSGAIHMTIDSVANGTTSATMTATNLVVAGGLATFNGTATIARSSAANGSGTTQTSTIAATGLTLAGSYNGRNDTFTVGSLAGTRVTTWDATPAVTGWTWSGSDALSGTAGGSRTFSTTTATTSTLAYGADGTPTAGAWTVTRSDGKITATISGSSVMLTVDDGSDGTIDDSWTDTLADLEAAIG